MLHVPKCVPLNSHAVIFRTFSRQTLLRSPERMQTAFVYINDGEDHLKLTFPYRDAVVNKKKLMFQRPVNETLETTFARIMLKITGLHEKKEWRKKKKKTQCEAGTKDSKVDFLPMNIVRNGLNICKNTLNSDAWSSDSHFLLGDNKYKINVNPPAVLSIKLPSELMAGFPAIPYAQLQYANIENSSFVWYKSEIRIEDKDRTVKESNMTEVDYSNLKWIPITTGYVYKVRNGDVGHLLRVVCYPKLKDEEVECISDEAVGKTPVGAGPDACPYHIRHEVAKEKCADESFRVSSYNILANCYADSDYSREHLFSYCPPYALAWDYRKQLLLDEIGGYNSDILCLQEVDRKAFFHDFEFFFKFLGLIGQFDLKGEEMHEGLACFYNQQKFRLVNRYAINLSEEVQKNENMSDILNKVKQNETLCQRFFERKTILQILELEFINDNSKRLIVANTHLYFHPNADHIRLLQGAVIIKYIEELLSLKCFEHKDLTYSVIICGDFNSCPEFGVYQLMLSQYVPEDSADWKSCPEEAVENLSISHSLNLESSYGCPQYTNYTLLFNGCLDYIFYDNNNLKLLKNIPLPSHDEVTLYKAIPNIVFPSDHLCLISDFQWK